MLNAIALALALLNPTPAPYTQTDAERTRQAEWHTGYAFAEDSPGWLHQEGGANAHPTTRPTDPCQLGGCAKPVVQGTYVDSFKGNWRTIGPSDGGPTAGGPSDGGPTLP